MKSKGVNDTLEDPGTRCTNADSSERVRSDGLQVAVTDSTHEELASPASGVKALSEKQERV